MVNKTDMTYKPQEIEARWQEVWEQSKIFSPDVSSAPNPYYNLMMFPYPSAEGLHVGNMYAFTGADVYAKFNRMQGKDVLEPIGLDGFGIHSENYALKIGKHPKEQAEIAEKNFYRQLRSIGNSFDWQRTVETYDPGYYKWTQWLFIQLFKAGLAYRATALVNWCPKDMTVLSDEQVIDGLCERCGEKVEKKNLEQWFFKITDYADRLLNGLAQINWSEKVKIAQTNWIGKSEGAEVEFRIKNQESSIKVFTTRPDTLFGATFMVVAPEHELVSVILNSFQNLEIPKQVRDDVLKYVEEAKNKTEIERTRSAGHSTLREEPSSSDSKSSGQAGSENEKTGVFSGLYAINPVNNEKIPVWIADYVLSGYGTGAIMAVPAHDLRDFAFAKKYELPIIPVIANEVKQSSGIAASQVFDREVLDSESRTRRAQTESAPRNDNVEEPFEGDGVLVNSGEWDGWEMPKDMGKVLEWLERKGLGTRKANYHLRDWLISRQRYWGPPIPMIYCQSCANWGNSWFTSDEAKEKNELRIPKQESGGKDHNSLFMLHDSTMAGWFPVPEDQLPVLLPDVADWKPMGTGKSPLANHPEFYKTKCPNCGGEADRETDVSDTFLDSSWYFLRYPSVDIENAPFDMEVTRKWLPVHMYIGGAEHSVLHLLYSRFVTMVLKDLNFLTFEEPFSNFFAHGLIIKDGVKMSKSKGNVVVPDEYIGKYGADTLRAYLMFIGPYSDGGDFRDTGIEGMHRFMKKVWRLMAERGPVVAPPPSDVLDLQDSSAGARRGSPSASHPLEEPILQEHLRFMHKTIQGVTKDISEFGYNTAIAKLMEWYNFLSAQRTASVQVSKEEKEVFLKLLAPFAPHMTEELWQKMKHESRVMNDGKENENNNHDSEFVIHDSIHLSEWPKWDEKYLVSETIIIPVQINGKRRGEIEVQSSKCKDQSEIEQLAKEVVSKYLEGVEVKKIIYVNGKIVNFVV